MGSCKIQKPTSAGSGKHGKVYVQIVCNDIAGDEHKFDARKGDLRLHLECEEDNDYAFYIGDDCKLEIEKLNKKIKLLEDQLNSEINFTFDLSEFENYINNNPI